MRRRCDSCACDLGDDESVLCAECRYPTREGVALKAHPKASMTEGLAWGFAGVVVILVVWLLL